MTQRRHYRSLIKLDDAAYCGSGPAKPQRQAEHADLAAQMEAWRKRKRLAEIPKDVGPMEALRRIKSRNRLGYKTSTAKGGGE